MRMITPLNHQQSLKRWTWLSHRLFAAIVTAGLITLTLCPKAQSADWSSYANGINFSCKVTNLSWWIGGVWNDFDTEFSCGDPSSKNIIHCKQHTHIPSLYRCIVGRSGNEMSCGDKYVKMHFSEKFDIELAPGTWNAENKVCERVFSFANIAVRPLQ